MPFLRLFWLLLIALLFGPGLPGAAQPGAAQPPRGRFVQDSVQVCKPFLYVLTYVHSPQVDVFFPDSTSDFAPFELVGRNYFPTRTTQTGSLDSVVYTLVSFDVDPIQRLAVPVYVRTERDCTARWSAPDSVRYVQMIPDVSRIDGLRADTRWRPVSEHANYPLLLAVTLGLLAGAGLIYWTFGEPIRRWLRMLQLRRRHLEFGRNFQRLSRGVTARKQDLARAERAVVLWKRYVERLEQKPVSTFTTREIIDNFPDEPKLAEALRELDAVMYGGVFSPRTSTSLQSLRELARERYRRRRREIAQEGRLQPPLSPVEVT